MNITKFEANLIRRDESLVVHNQFNYAYTMESIRRQFGPFNPDEIAFFKRNLENDQGNVINNFQRQLIFNLFYKYFGDTASINSINQENYIELMIAARTMLRNYNLAYLPYILTGKVNKIVSRKVLNKKEQAEMNNSQYYMTVQDKYKNDKILQQILGTIATLITSSFSVIDFYEPKYHGKELRIDSKIIIEETLLYTLLI